MRAAILDLDGVITSTEKLHARSWKQMFDAYFEERNRREGTQFAPFSIERDYREHVDGKPRYDGVRDMLAARGIEIPEGKSDDDPDRETVRGLGNRKNRTFLDLVQSEGVQAYTDAEAQIRRWRRAGLRLAVVSSSRNCGSIVEAAGLADLFDIRVDGNDLAHSALKGKPAPDMFLEAARRLGVRPEQAAIFEDAISGVQAGRAGRFRWVVGVDRSGDGELERHGANVVVARLDELEIPPEESHS
ncbi:MAG: beta-phosphoglucomutase family hydrolase [Candidatus Eisenbacteria bacterium]|nr:beta-phosphoglucomutase family hydrolase [Candidatus Eisenbacteria bacterium]